MFKEKISYVPSIDHLGHFFNKEICSVFETAQTAKVYKPKTIIALDPILEFKGFDNRIEVNRYSDSSEFDFSTYITNGDFFFKKETTCSAEIVRNYLTKKKSNESNFAGLYGAFGFEFINQYYPIKRHSKSGNLPDFHLFEFSTYIVFEHDKEQAFIESDSLEKVKRARKLFLSEESCFESFIVSDIEIEPSKKDFESQVEHVRSLCSKGEVYEAVIARQIKMTINGSPFSLFNSYKKKNPSPYMFFINFGKNEYILGASPEMMIRVQDNTVEIRPISGTAKRGNTAFDDHENMMNLLNSKKEKSELDMLIDLARNDLNRVCKPGLEISDYRYVEKYSRVMHTVAHVKGELDADKTAFDALISCLNAGTLTGAPKIAAMNTISEIENFPREYYGGSVGYLAFNGNCDTAILIRSAHIKDGIMNYKSGATLLYDSDPTLEFEESEHKASAFINSLNFEKVS